MSEQELTSKYLKAEFERIGNFKLAKLFDEQIKMLKQSTPQSDKSGVLLPLNKLLTQFQERFLSYLTDNQ